MIEIILLVIACSWWVVDNIRNGMKIEKLKGELREATDRLTLRDQVLTAYENDAIEFNKREADSLEALKRFNHRMADYCRDREEWNATLLAKNAEIEGLHKAAHLANAEFHAETERLNKLLSTAGVRPPEQQEREHDFVGAVGCHAAGACGCNRKTMPREMED